MVFRFAVETSLNSAHGSRCTSRRNHGCQTQGLALQRYSVKLVLHHELETGVAHCQLLNGRSRCIDGLVRNTPAQEERRATARVRVVTQGVGTDHEHVVTFRDGCVRAEVDQDGVPVHHSYHRIFPPVDRDGECLAGS